MKKLRIDVWSDIVCPWCYVGKRRLEAALAKFPRRDAVEVVWRAFERDPPAPAGRDEGTHAGRLARKYGPTGAGGSQRTQRMSELAAADRLRLRLGRVRPVRT